MGTADMIPEHETGEEEPLLQPSPSVHDRLLPFVPGLSRPGREGGETVALLPGPTRRAGSVKGREVVERGVPTDPRGDLDAGKAPPGEGSVGPVGDEMELPIGEPVRQMADRLSGEVEESGAALAVEADGKGKGEGFTTPRRPDPEGEDEDVEAAVKDDGVCAGAHGISEGPGPVDLPPATVEAGVSAMRMHCASPLYATDLSLRTGTSVHGTTHPSPRQYSLAAVLLVLLLVAPFTALPATAAHAFLSPPSSFTTTSGMRSDLTRVREIQPTADAGPTISYSVPARDLSSKLPPAPSGPLTTRITSVGVGTHPRSAAYNRENGYVYVLNYYSNNVSVINGTKVVATISVGSNSSSAAYDSRNGYVYVSNYGSNNVSVINGTKVVATINVGSAPTFATYDSGNGYVYLLNSGSNNVSVINGTKVVATISVGIDPSFAAYDSGNDYVYVADSISGSLSVINGTKVIATIYVGNVPYFPSYDSGNGYVYAPNYGSASVSVISGTKVVATTGVGSFPTFAAYDSGNGYVYMSNYGSNDVSVINGTKVVATINVGSAPTFAAYDSGNGYVYVPNYGSDNVSIIEIAYGLTFTEVGLPNGTAWSVDIAGGPSTVSNSSTFSLDYYYGMYSYTASSTDPTYAAQGGTFDFNSSSTQKTIVFSRVTYPVSFIETGLPVGTNWSATLAGVFRSSETTTISFRETNGTYPYVLGLIPGWTTPNFTGSVDVNGRGVNESAPWSQVTYVVTFTEDGLPGGTGWWVNVTGGFPAFSLTPRLSLREPNGTFEYSVATLNKSYASDGESFVVGSEAVFETVTFSLVVYGATFTEFGLAVGTNWSVTLGGVLLYSTTSTLAFSEPNGTYLFRVFSVNRYTAAPNFGALSLNGVNATRSIVFTALPPPLTHEVTFTESGLSSGTDWSVTLDGKMHSGRGSIAFSGIANGTFPFTVGIVGGYTASPASGSIPVSGENITKTIAFTPTPTSPSTFLGLPAAEGYAVVGGSITLVIVLVAVLWTRRKRISPGPGEAHRVT